MRTYYETMVFVFLFNKYGGFKWLSNLSYVIQLTSNRTCVQILVIPLVAGALNHHIILHPNLGEQYISVTFNAISSIAKFVPGT